MKNYGVIRYKNTQLWAIFYFCPHAGHVYLDVRFDTKFEAECHVLALEAEQLRFNNHIT